MLASFPPGTLGPLRTVSISTYRGTLSVARDCSYIDIIPTAWIMGITYRGDNEADEELRSHATRAGDLTPYKITFYIAVYKDK